MSTTYNVYIEVFINDRWVSIEPKIKDLWTNTYKDTCTYSNYSRTYFGEAYEKLDEISNKGAVQASELYEELSKNEYNTVIVVYEDNFEQTIRTHVSDRLSLHEYSGFVLKEDIVSYIMGEIEDLEYLDVKDYENLSTESKKAYVYFEWDNPYGWYKYFKILKDCIYTRIRDFREAQSKYYIDIKYRFLVEKY